MALAEWIRERWDESIMCSLWLQFWLKDTIEQSNTLLLLLVLTKLSLWKYKWYYTHSHDNKQHDVHMYINVMQDDTHAVIQRIFVRLLVTFPEITRGWYRLKLWKKPKLKLKTSTFSLCIFSLRRCIVRKVLPRIQSKKIIWTYSLSMKMIKEMIIILVYSFERKISWIGKCPSKPIVIVDVMDIGYFNFQHQSKLTGTSLETFLVWWSLHHCRFLSHTYTGNLKKNNVLVDFLIFHNFGRKS